MNLINLWSEGRLGKQPLQTLRVIATIEPRCNLTCEHCYWSHDLESVSPREWDEQVKEIKKLNTPLFFAGRILNEKGASFLRKVLADSATPFLGIVDNGLTIADYPEFLHHYQSINVSIDGWRESHDAQRNCKGLFDRVWKTVMSLKEGGYDPVISSAISPLTLNNWDKFEDLLIRSDVPMSSTLVWNLPETAKRGTAVFSSRNHVRQAFLRLVEGMPKLINLYSIEYVEILSDLLSKYEWKFDEETGDCLTATLPSRTIIIYRPVSLVSIAELSLEWDGRFYCRSTYSKKYERNKIDESFHDAVRKENQQELAAWQKITQLVNQKGG